MSFIIYILFIIFLFYSDAPHCSKTDNLYFTCSNCNKSLCQNHSHSQINCPYLKTLRSTNNNNFNNINLGFNKCNFCKKESVYKNVKCKLCKIEFCIAHRLESDHKCQKSKSKYDNNIIKDKNCKKSKDNNCLIF